MADVTSKRYRVDDPSFAHQAGGVFQKLRSKGLCRLGLLLLLAITLPVVVLFITGAQVLSLSVG